MLFIRKDIPVKLLSLESKSIEILYIELNIRKKKWLLSCSYNPNKNTIMNDVDALKRKLDLYLTQYEHLILLEGFNHLSTNLTKWSNTLKQSSLFQRI